MIAFPQHSNRVGEARAVVNLMARSVVSLFADQHGASGGSAEREICHYKNNVLRTISFQIHSGRGGRRQHYLMKLWTSTPVPIPQHLRSELAHNVVEVIGQRLLLGFGAGKKLRFRMDAVSARPIAG